MKLKKYLKIWWILTTRTTQVAFTTRFGAATFVVGKILRFAIVLLFIVALVSKTKSLAGYSLWQVIFFFATYNLVDTLPQFFLREVYRFRSAVVSGTFDHVLTKPLSPLFRALFGGTDVLDISMIIVSAGFILYSLPKLGSITLTGIILYIALVINAFLIALAFHIAVLSIGILTTEVDNTIMLYRDLTQMGRFPIDIYREPVREILTFAIPVGIMMTFPPKALLGLLSPQAVGGTVSLAAAFLYSSLVFWNYSLKHYSSASS